MEKLTMCKIRKVLRFRYRNWFQTINPLIRIDQRAGQSMFINYAKMRVGSLDR
jgi:hypothetical protein